jgi:hypothetical protein
MLKIEISEQEAQLILNGLGELKAKESIEFILKFRLVCEQQIEVNRNKQINKKK